VANPQKENGYTPIANEIMDYLCHFRIPGEVRLIVDCVIRKTYGYNKKEDWIAHSQLIAMTRMKKGNVSRSLSQAITNKLVIRSDNKFRFNKNYDEWIRFGVIKSDNQKKVIKSDTGVIKKTTAVIKSEGYKRQYTKDNIQKTYIETDVSLTEILYTLIKRNYPFIKEKSSTKKEEDYKEMNRLQRLDGYSYEQIEWIIRWCQQDDFWKQNIRSVKKLREKFEQLIIKAKGEYDKRKVVNFDK